MEKQLRLQSYLFSRLIFLTNYFNHARFNSWQTICDQTLIPQTFLVSSKIHQQPIPWSINSNQRVMIKFQFICQKNPNYPKIRGLYVTYPVKYKQLEIQENMFSSCCSSKELFQVLQELKQKEGHTSVPPKFIR